MAVLRKKNLYLTQDQSHLSTKAVVNGDTRGALIIFFFVLCVRANDTARNNFRHFENMLSLLLYPNHCNYFLRRLKR